MMEIARGASFVPLGAMGTKIYNSIYAQLDLLITINKSTQDQGDFEKIKKRREVLTKFRETNISKLTELVCFNQNKFVKDGGDKDLAANLAYVFGTDALTQFADPVKMIIQIATGEKVDLLPTLYKAGPAVMFDRATARVFGAPRLFADHGINADLARTWAVVEYVKNGTDDDGGTIRSCLDQIAAINIYIVEKIQRTLEEKDGEWLTASVRQDLVNLKDKLSTYRRNVIGVMKNIHLSPDLALGDVIPFLATIDGVVSIRDYLTASCIHQWRYDERAIWLLLAAATGMDLTIKTVTQSHTSLGESQNRIGITLGPILVYAGSRERDTMLLRKGDAYYVLSDYLTATEEEEDNV